MTESNPPAQPDKKELRRRLLFLVAEPHRRSDPPYHDAIAEELNEAEDTIRDQLWILDHQGFVFLQTLLDFLIPNITPEGLLEVEKLTQTAPQPDPPPISEPSPESQEFQHSLDYASVNWRGQEYQFNEDQATCVRLLHEAWLEGTPYLSGHHLLTTIEGAVKMSGLFKRHPAWKHLILIGERKATYRLNLSP